MIHTYFTIQSGKSRCTNAIVPINCIKAGSARAAGVWGAFIFICNNNKHENIKDILITWQYELKYRSCVSFLVFFIVVFYVLLLVLLLLVCFAWSFFSLCVCVCMCASACVCVYVRACVCVCARAHVFCVLLLILFSLFLFFNSDKMLNSFPWLKSIHLFEHITI
jgi:hypothetical protein